MPVLWDDLDEPGYGGMAADERRMDFVTDRRPIVSITIALPRVYGGLGSPASNGQIRSTLPSL